MSVCSKFCQLFCCQILFELVYSWQKYRKNKRVNFFSETRCTIYGSLAVNRLTIAVLEVSLKASFTGDKDNLNFMQSCWHSCSPSPQNGWRGI